MPLLLTHGWPGSFLEYLPVISALTDPEAHGGDAADAFSVVVPSLPGFGFSGPPPPDGLSADDVASLWDRLMTDGLGYQRYAAHGSDLGAGITARLARAHPEHVAGIHLATPGLPTAPKPPLTAAEAAYLDAAAAWVGEEGGYAHQQSTKPATLAAALADSPAGLAAWIGEKVLAWSSVRDDGGPAFDREILLGTLTLYWATNTIGSSLLPYWAGRHLPVTDLAEGTPASVPTAVSIFGGERTPFPSRPGRWWPGTSTWFDGPNIAGADISRGGRAGAGRRCPAHHVPFRAMTRGVPFYIGGCGQNVGITGPDVGGRQATPRDAGREPRPADRTELRAARHVHDPCQLRAPSRHEVVHVAAAGR